MNRIYTCRKCFAAYSVPAIDPNLHLLKGKLRCPNSAVCKSTLRAAASTNIKPIFTTSQLTAVELYQATMGTGMPAERKCSPKDLRKIMTGATITGVEIDLGSPKDRSFLHSITLDNGKTLHLAPSTKGVAVFKVTQKEAPRGRRSSAV